MEKDKYVAMVEAKGSKWTEEKGTKWEGVRLTEDQVRALSDADFAEYAAIVRTRAAKDRKAADESQAALEQVKRDAEIANRRYADICRKCDELDTEVEAMESVSHSTFGL